MVVGDFNIIHTLIGPSEANAELLVNANAVLSLPVADERFQAVAGGAFQVFQIDGGVKDQEFGSCPPADVGWQGSGGEAVKKFFGFLA